MAKAARILRGLAFFCMLLSVPVWMLSHGAYAKLRQAAFSKDNRLVKLEQVALSYLPKQEALRRLRVEMGYWGGSKEQNGVFIGDNTLMKNLQPSQSEIITDNVSGMIEIAKTFDRPSYLMLIPTACAIQQSKVPYQRVTPLYNQRELIDRVYQQMSGSITAIDVYPTLFNHQNEYIYYRTDSSPTGMGGYYIYSIAAKKLGFSNVRGIEQFAVEHLDYSYLGDLYEKAPYYAVEPDRISAYEYARGFQSYTITHYDENGSRKYFSLYPQFKLAFGKSKDVILGGVSPVVDIQAGSSQNRRRLLVLGDDTMQSYLPFFLNHYSRVTFVNTAQVRKEYLSTLAQGDYNQILFAYSTDRFVEQKQFEELKRLWATG